MNLFYILLQLYIPEYIYKITFPQIILYILTICVLLKRLISSFPREPTQEWRESPLHSPALPQLTTEGSSVYA